MISSLEEQLEQAKGEVTAVKAELAASKRAAAAEREKAKAELAAAKRAAEAELEKVKAELAAAKKAAKAERERGDAERATVQQLLAGLERLKTTTSAARSNMRPVHRAPVFYPTTPWPWLAPAA
jgi:uncharacterized membrane protein YqiK